MNADTVIMPSEAIREAESESSNRDQLLAPQEGDEGTVSSGPNSEKETESPSVPSKWSHISKLIAAVAPTEMCPAMTRLHFVATRLEIYSMLGALLYVLISFSWAEPIRDPVLQLSTLFVVAQTFGTILSFARLPPLLGMLLAGILLRQVNFFHAEGGFLKFTATVRACAMTMILLRAGLGLNASALRRLSMVVLRVAVIPCSAEAVTVALVSHYLLDFPWQWGFLLGFVLGAVSPAVVVPSLLALQSDGYGENKGIATLVIASSSLDDIFAITMFGVFLSTIFSQGSIFETILQGPLEVLIGITWGILMGVISIYIPHSEEKSVAMLRTAMVGASGLLSVLGSQLVGYPGAGPLGCIVGAFVAACGWRAFSSSNTYEPVMAHLTGFWLFLQPFLFGLIGTEINVSALNGNLVGLSVLVMLIAIVVRLVACCLAVQGCGLNFKETLFVGLSWLPKATVQAALGPVALDVARSSLISGDHNTQLAEGVLTISVLSIILTAPLGAVGILGAGPFLLSKSKTEESIVEQGSGIVDQGNRESQHVV